MLLIVMLLTEIEAADFDFTVQQQCVAIASNRRLYTIGDDVVTCQEMGSDHDRHTVEGHDLEIHLAQF